ncbi:MAG: flagellar filament capping protein FliD [Candidatus Poribacteria bacterium]|nr:flagellar filament capping protein FliD [Candidatus Poribacteria bacterium]
MSDVSFSGLSSGIDTASLIEQLMQLERRPIRRLERQQTTISHKEEAVQSFNTKLSALKSSAETLTNEKTFQAFQASTPENDVLSISVDNDTAVGSYTVEVSQLAKAEQLSSGVYTDKTAEIGLSGNILINGTVVDLDSTDTLENIRDKINAAKADVTASILSVSTTDYRLLISADSTGTTGVQIAEGGSGNLLEQLGFTDGTTGIKHAITSGADSDEFSSGTNAIGTLLNLNTPQSGTIQIDGNDVSIDLTTDSIDDIKNAINGAAISGVTASVEEVTADDDTTTYKLRISGSTSFTDDNNILQALGILEGGRTDVTEVLTGSETNTTGRSASNITASTHFTAIGGASPVDGSSTVSMSGTKHDGTSVSGTYTYATGDTVQDFLDEIETVFGLSAGSATIRNGQLAVTDDTAGESQLAVSLSESHFGSLDFGAVSTTTKGRKRELQAGQDAELTINNINISHSSNTVTDVIEGVTLNLLDTNANTGDAPVTISVERNNSMIEGAIQTFIDNYNEVRSFINEQFTLDTKTSRGGLLFGDSMLRTIQTQFQRILSSTVAGLTGDYDHLISLGIASDRTGMLSMDSAKLRDALNTSISDVSDVFLGRGTASDSDITFIQFTNDTEAGAYNINITTAAEQATVSGSSGINPGGISQNETLTITDATSMAQAEIDLIAGDTISDIVSKINSTLNSKVAEVHTADTANHTDARDTSPITASDTFADIDGADVNAGDTITITGNDHDGSAVSSTYTISDTSNTLQDFLNTIASAFGNDVTATIDSSGKLVVTDNTAGTSDLSVTITSNNEGGGSLDFGALTASTEGRDEIFVTASDDSGVLKLTHDNDGAANGLSVVSNIDAGDDGTKIGTTTQTESGVDVVGTINGESATGNGRLLTGDGENAKTEGLRLLVNLTSDKLSAQGSAPGTVAITVGIGEELHRFVNALTDTIDGRITNKLKGFQRESDRLQDRINQLEANLLRLEARLQRRFLAMEQAMNRIQSQGNFLLSQLGIAGGNR